MKRVRPAAVTAALNDARFLAAVAVASDDDAWREVAACRGVPDPELFYPQSSGWNETHFRAPLRICSGCAVTAQCLASALRLGDREGVWGDTTPGEREPMLIAWRRRNSGGVADSFTA